MFDTIVSFTTGNPTAVFAILAIIGILLWLLGYSVGNKDGHLEQHEREMRFLCSENTVEFEVVNTVGDRWLVTSTKQESQNKKEREERRCQAISAAVARGATIVGS